MVVFPGVHGFLALGRRLSRDENEEVWEPKIRKSEVEKNQPNLNESAKMAKSSLPETNSER